MPSKIDGKRVNRSTALIIAGALLLLASASVPFVTLAVTEWDTDYVYTTETGESYCATAVREDSSVEGDGFRVSYENLSSTGRKHFERTLADGRYVVEDEADTAPDFQFTDDHVAPGEGCYAIRYEGENYALRTKQTSEKVGLASGRWPSLIGGGLLVLGTGSLLTGVVLAVKRWRG